jgi:uncharacterized protein (TIGR03437 family)
VVVGYVSLGSGCAWAQIEPGLPYYTAESIYHAAINQPGPYAGNTIISIYGTNLSPDTAVTYGVDSLPVSAGSGHVRVLIGGQLAGIFFVSPTQINALIPSNLIAGPVTVRVAVKGLAGPTVTLRLLGTAPGLFEMGGNFVVATRGNGPVATERDPARPGDIVVLYATGLGLTAPEMSPNQIPATAASLVDRSLFQVWINATPVPRTDIVYVGVTPGFAGLYQVNVKLPLDCPPDPEIRVVAGGQLSPPGRKLHVR